MKRFIQFINENVISLCSQSRLIDPLNSSLFFVVYSPLESEVWRLYELFRLSPCGVRQLDNIVEKWKFSTLENFSNKREFTEEKCPTHNSSNNDNDDDIVHCVRIVFIFEIKFQICSWINCMLSRKILSKWCRVHHTHEIHSFSLTRFCVFVEQQSGLQATAAADVHIARVQLESHHHLMSEFRLVYSLTSERFSRI